MDLIEFEDLKEFEGLYKINRNGEIKGGRYNNILTSYVDGGYLRISLTKDKVRKTYRIHRLLAIQYIPNPDNLPEIDHIDRNKLNNELSNLRWCDRITNANNKNCSIANMTEEQKEERINNIREYKRGWIEKKHRANGIEPKKIQEGSIYEYVRKDNGKTYWKGVYRKSDGKLIQKSSAKKEVIEEWLNDLKNF